MTQTAKGIGIKRLQHIVLYVADVERSVRFYCDVLGFEVSRQRPGAAFLHLPHNDVDHDLGLFEQPGARPPDERTARMYHAAWEVGDITDLRIAQQKLAEAGALVGASNHGTSLSLYAVDPDGLEFEVFWMIPGGKSGQRSALDLEGEIARRGKH